MLSTWITRIALNNLYDRRRKGGLPTKGVISIQGHLGDLEGALEADPLDTEEAQEIDFNEEQTEYDSDIVRGVKSVWHLLSDEERTILHFDLYESKERYLEEFNVTDDLYRKRKSRAYEKLRDLVTKKNERR